MSSPVVPTPLRAAVVGSGGISNAHLSYLAGRTSFGPVDDRVVLTGVCDLSPVSASYAAATFGPASVHTDLAEMLDRIEPDVLHVLTPPHTHRTLAAAALGAGCHVICEKPITSSGAELDELLAIAAEHDRTLIESHNYRFNASVRRVKDLIDAGRLGPIREVDIRISLPVTSPDDKFGDPNLANPVHALPGGVVQDFTTHFCYLLRHLAPGVRYDRVAAAWSRHGDNELFRYDDLDALLIGHGPDGPVHARLRFDARTAPDTFTIVVRGGDGLVETDLFQPHLRFVGPRPGPSKLAPIVNHLSNGAALIRAGVQNFGQKLLQDGPYEGLHRMLDEIYTALATGTEPPITAEDLRATSALVDLLLEKRETL